MIKIDVNRNIEQVSEMLKSELSGENEKEKQLNKEDGLENEFKSEINKIKLGMLQLIEQMQNVEKDTKVFQIKDVERIESKSCCCEPFVAFNFHSLYYSAMTSVRNMLD